MTACKLLTVSALLLKLVKLMSSHCDLNSITILIMFPGTGLPDWGIALVVVFAVITLFITIVTITVIVVVARRKGELITFSC